jgi:hypothetical protein
MIYCEKRSEGGKQTVEEKERDKHFHLVDGHILPALQEQRPGDGTKLAQVTVPRIVVRFLLLEGRKGTKKSKAAEGLRARRTNIGEALEQGVGEHELEVVEGRTLDEGEVMYAFRLMPGGAVDCGFQQPREPAKGIATLEGVSLMADQVVREVHEGGRWRHMTGSSSGNEYKQDDDERLHPADGMKIVPSFS